MQYIVSLFQPITRTVETTTVNAADGDHAARAGPGDPPSPPWRVKGVAPVPTPGSGNDDHGIVAPAAK